MRIAWMTLICILALGGCAKLMEDPIEISLGSTAPPAAAPRGNDKIEQRFIESKKDTPGAVESALMWSKKYDDLTVRTEKFMEKNTALFKENTELKHKLSGLQIEMKQTKKELNEANNFLQEMQLELNQWKGDVLGFRDEMRRAQKSQLDALSRILRILGAETAQPVQ